MTGRVFLCALLLAGGCFYSCSVTRPALVGPADFDPRGKVGESVAVRFDLLGYFTGSSARWGFVWPDGGRLDVANAARRGRITRVSCVDVKVTHYPLVRVERTIVYGE